MKHPCVLTFIDWPWTREGTTNKPGQTLWSPFNLVPFKPLSLYLIAGGPAFLCLLHPYCAVFDLCYKTSNTEVISLGSSQISCVSRHIVHILSSPGRSCKKVIFNCLLYTEVGEGTLVTSSPNYYLFCLFPWAANVCCVLYPFCFLTQTIWKPVFWAHLINVGALDTWYTSFPPQEKPETGGFCLNLKVLCKEKCYNNRISRIFLADPVWLDSCFNWEQDYPNWYLDFLQRDSVQETFLNHCVHVGYRV